MEEETEPVKTAEGALADILKKYFSWAPDEWLSQKHIQKGYVFLLKSGQNSAWDSRSCSEVNIAKK